MEGGQGWVLGWASEEASSGRAKVCVWGGVGGGGRSSSRVS